MVSSPLTPGQVADIEISLNRRIFQLENEIWDRQREVYHLQTRLRRLDRPVTGWVQSPVTNGRQTFQREFNMSPGNWREENPQVMNISRSLLTPPRSPLLRRLRAASEESDTGNLHDQRRVRLMFGNQTQELENPFLME